MKLFILSLVIAVTFSVSANSPLPNGRHISITGNASKSVKPDTALVHMHVESVKLESLDAKRDVDDRVNSFLAGIGKFNIKEEDVSASKIRIDPEYDYGKNGRNKVIGYKASRRLKVTLKNLEDLNALLDFTLGNKINGIENINFKSSEEKKIQDEVNALAVADAKKRAGSLATAFDAKLGKIYSINSSSSSNRDRYGMNAEFDSVTVMGSRIRTNGKPGQYLQENIQFSASISVVFELTVTAK